MDRTVAATTHNLQTKVADNGTESESEPRSELLRVHSRFDSDSGLTREPLEPTLLSLDATHDSTSGPLFLRIVAPTVLAEGFKIEVAQPWFYPFRLARAAVRLPIEYESLGFADRKAVMECIVGCMSSTATLAIPGYGLSTNQEVLTLQTSARCDCRCVLIEIPIPAEITLHPGATILLTVCIAGSPMLLSIRAAGHIHSGNCNHKRLPQGAVWRAADAGNVAAIRIALAAGGSTEETDSVRRSRWRCSCLKFYWRFFPVPVPKDSPLHRCT